MSSFSPNSAQISNQTISAGSQTLSDHNALRAVGVTVNGGVSFIAGQSIRLSNGFRATAGTASTTFHAWVQTLPVAVSVAPASGGGLSQTFTWTASSPSGWASLAEVYGLFNTMTTGRISSLLAVSGRSWRFGVDGRICAGEHGDDLSLGAGQHRAVLGVAGDGDMDGEFSRAQPVLPHGHHARYGDHEDGVR